MKQFKIHPAAEQDLIEAREWYDERSEVAGQAFALEVDHAIRSIVESPLRWPRGSRGERRYVLDRFPYTILYRIREDYLFVMAIAHQSRRPGYWRHRK